MTKTSDGIKTFIKEYQAYHDAKNRCTNINHARYHDWGGRGIGFFFTSFWEFLEEIGPAPEGHSLDRIDNNKGYEKGNVRWSTRSEQQLNRRRGCHNTSGLTGVRVVKAKGLVTPTYQSYVNKNHSFKQLYTGPDFFEAVCARKSFDNQNI